MITLLQAQAIISLLMAFGVPQPIIDSVQIDLEGTTTAQTAPITINAPSSVPQITIAPPTFGAVEPTQQPSQQVVVAPCDDTPSFNVKQFTLDGANNSTYLDSPTITSIGGTYPYLYFNVQVKSACNSTWLVDEHYTNAGRHPVDRYGVDQSQLYQGVWQTYSPATTLITFVAHDDKTSGTTTITATAQ